MTDMVFSTSGKGAEALSGNIQHQHRSQLTAALQSYDSYPGNGNVAGLLNPFSPTALTPKIALSFDNSTVALLTSPTAMTCVQKGSSVARHTISYPASPVSSPSAHRSVELFVSTELSTVTFLGVPGADASENIVARLTRATRAMKSKSQNSIRSPNCTPFSTRTF